MLIKAALNGARKKSEYILIPQSPEELASEAKKSVEAGAGAIHFHVYDKNGNESLHFNDVGNSLSLIRKTCPGIPLGISTGEWIVPNLNERLKLIGEWKIIPDFVSVNIDENGVEDICKILIEKNIKIEAGISSEKDVKNFLKLNIVDKTIRILIEPVEDLFNEALNSVLQIEKALDDHKINIPRLLHGFENTAWELIELAFDRNYETRIGFEDTIFLPDGTKAKSNAELVNHSINLKNKKENL